MTETIIKIGDKTFKLEFSLKVLRLLGETLGSPTVNGTATKIFEAMDIGPEIEFEKIAVMFHLIVASVEATPNNVDTITYDELERGFLKHTVQILEVLKVVMQGFVANLPAAELGKLTAQLQSKMNEQNQMIQPGTV